MHKPKRIRPVILAVSSGGGHWVQMQRLKPAFAGAEVHYAVTDATTATGKDAGRVHVYPDANKDTPLRLLLCLVRLAWIVLRVRPDVVRVDRGGRRFPGNPACAADRRPDDVHRQHRQRAGAVDLGAPRAGASRTAFSPSGRAWPKSPARNTAAP